MKILIQISLMIFACGNLAAQSLPKVDRALMAGVLAARMNDAASTRYDLNSGNIEMFLPHQLADSTTGMIAFGLGSTYLQYEFSKWAIKHNHAWIAHTSEVIHITSVGYFGLKNWTL